MEREFKWLVDPAMKSIEKASASDRKSAMVRLANYVKRGQSSWKTVQS